VNTAVLLFDGVQIIDYTGPWEAFGRVGTVYGVSIGGAPITTSMGMQVVPNHALGQEPLPDVLVVPGGGNSGEPGSTPHGVGAQLANPAVIEWIRATAERATTVLSVCNGAFLAQRAGLLDGKSATTTASYLAYLAKIAPLTRVVPDRVVDNGKVVTAGGLSSGIDGALHVIERLEGRGAAMQVALGMEYDWEPGKAWSRARLADFHVPAALYGAIAGAGLVVVDLESTLDQATETYRITSSRAPDEVVDVMNENLARAGWQVLAADGAERPGASTRARGSDSQGSWDVAAVVRPEEDPTTLLVKIGIRAT
jgi:putative intracellular protease/amidase